MGAFRGTACLGMLPQIIICAFQSKGCTSQSLRCCDLVTDANGPPVCLCVFADGEAGNFTCDLIREGLRHFLMICIVELNE